MDTIIKELHDAKEYGSILTVTRRIGLQASDCFAEITDDINMSRGDGIERITAVGSVAEALAQHDVV